jgi:SAM-dependent methyltransferase
LSEADRIARAYHELEARAGSRWNLANRGNQAILAERTALTRKLFGRAGMLPLGDRRVLEVGSGGGGELARMLELEARPSQLVGVDLLPDRVAAARKRYPELTFHARNAERLEFPDGSFDVVMALTVFSSILDRQMAANVAAEIERVLCPGGALLWYDVRYDSAANHDVRGVSKVRLGELFPGFTGEVRSVTVAPPIARRLGRLARIGYPLLSRVPPLRSHLLALLRKPQA